jgi:hypothetical protein
MRASLLLTSILVTSGFLAGEAAAGHIQNIFASERGFNVRPAWGWNDLRLL